MYTRPLFKDLSKYLSKLAAEGKYSQEFCVEFHKRMKSTVRDNPMNVIRSMLPEYAETAPVGLDNLLLNDQQVMHYVEAFCEKLISPEQIKKMEVERLQQLFKHSGIALMRAGLMTAEKSATIPTAVLSSRLQDKAERYLGPNIGMGCVMYKY